MSDDKQNNAEINENAQDSGAPVVENKIAETPWTVKLAQNTMLYIAFATMFAVVVVVVYSQTTKTPNPIKRMLMRQEDILTKSDYIATEIAAAAAQDAEILRLLRELQVAAPRGEVARTAVPDGRCAQAVRSVQDLSQSQTSVDAAMATLIADLLQYIDAINNKTTNVTPPALTGFVTIKKDEVAQDDKQFADTLSALLRRGLDLSGLRQLTGLLRARNEEVLLQRAIALHGRLDSDTSALFQTKIEALVLACGADRDQ
jgi:hypothetical protein